MIGPAPVPKYTVPRPVYEEVIVEQQRARHPPDPFQVIDNIRARVENAMGIPDVVSNPLFFGILEDIRSNYTVFEEVLAPRSRSRGPGEQYGLIL
jgi:hypothetical protein